MRSPLFVTASTWVLISIFSSLVDFVLPWKLCPEENQWYDADTGKCDSCTPCLTKAMELEACSEFRNTLCADLKALRFDFMEKQPAAADTEMAKAVQVLQHRWHEMETVDDPPQVLTAAVARLSQESNPTEQDRWDIEAILLCIASAAAICAVVVLLGKNIRSAYFYHRDNRRVAARARLFSRDRLNTTEYMHNLATLDRRLAMDEILENRKKAMFEPPQLLCENVYTDDVFIDISGFPREHGASGSGEQDREHRQSLLSTEERLTVT